MLVARMRFPELSSSTAMTPLPQPSLLCSRGLWNRVTSSPSGNPQILSLSQETLSICPQQPSPCCLDIYPLQMYGAYCAATTASGYSIIPRPFAVCLLSKQKYGGCYPYCDPCHFEMDALLGLLVGVQHNPASPAEAEAEYLGGVISHRLPWRCHQRSAPTLEPLKDVCSPLCCSCCTHLTASVLLSSWTTRR